jgi:hypothetical protein
MSGVDEANADGLASHEKCIEMSPMESKGDLDTDLFQGLSQQIAASQFTIRWVLQWKPCHDGIIETSLAVSVGLKFHYKP